MAVDDPCPVAERLRVIIRNVKVRIAYIGHPKEPRGSEGQPDWGAVIRELGEAAALLDAPAAPAVEGLVQALRERVWLEHDDATHWPAGRARDGHSGEFESCPHEDCQLVAAALASARTGE